MTFNEFYKSCVMTRPRMSCQKYTKLLVEANKQKHTYGTRIDAIEWLHHFTNRFRTWGFSVYGESFVSDIIWYNEGVLIFGFSDGPTDSIFLNFYDHQFRYIDEFGDFLIDEKEADRFIYQLMYLRHNICNSNDVTMIVLAQHLYDKMKYHAKSVV